MSFQTLHTQATKDAVPSNKIEISHLLREIDTLELKKQELLKTLSIFSTSVSMKNSQHIDAISYKSSNSGNFQNKIASKGLKALGKELQKSNEELSYANKGDGTNKPSHLYMALAKYLFYDQNGIEAQIQNDEELKSIENEFFGFEEKIPKMLKVKSFDNESVESASTKDNFSLSQYENSTFKESCLTASEQEKVKQITEKKLDFVWSTKKEKMLCKYADELNNDWSEIAQKLSSKKITPKVAKDHLSNKGSKPDSLKRTRSRFTLSEDQKIISMIYKIGQNWRDIAKALPGRTEGMVKNRFYSHIKRKYFNLIQNGKAPKEEEIEVKNEEEMEPQNQENEPKVLIKEDENPTNMNLVDFDQQSVFAENKNEENQNNNEFLAFFDEVNEDQKMDFEENFEYNLLKTPETTYHFEDYNNMLKMTPGEREAMEEDNEISSFAVENNNCNEKLKIRFLSDKIGDIEHLLQQTKSQINNFYNLES